MVVSAFYRTADNGDWTLVGTQTFEVLTADLLIGLAVSSHVDATPCNRHVRPRPDHSAGHASAARLDGRRHRPCRRAGQRHRHRFHGEGDRFRRRRLGTKDALHWAFRPATGDFFDRGARGQCRERPSLDQGRLDDTGQQQPRIAIRVSHRDADVREGRRLSGPHGDRWRKHADGGSRLSIAPPGWLRLTRIGTSIRAYFRQPKTDAWVNLGLIELPNLSATVEVGLAVSSHVDGTLATARFSEIAIEPVLTWTSAQIGPGESGSFVDGTFFSAMNRGADIWGNVGRIHLHSHAMERRRRVDRAPEPIGRGASVDERRPDVP